MALDSAFKRPISLDDLPQEVLDNIWKFYFFERRVSLMHPECKFRAKRGRSVDQLWTIGKKQGLTAALAMLQHAIIVVQSSGDVERLLNDYSDKLPIIRHLKIFSRAPAHDHPGIPFVAMDDLLRRCCQLRNISLSRSLMVISSVPNEPRHAFDAHLYGEICRGASWTRKIAKKMFAIHLGRPNEESILNTKGWCWLRDIIEGTAFAASIKTPNVEILFKLRLQCSPSCKRPVTQNFLYHFQEQALIAHIGGGLMSIKQDFTLPPYASEFRDGRGRLCSKQLGDESSTRDVDGGVSPES